MPPSTRFGVLLVASALLAPPVSPQQAAQPAPVPRFEASVELVLLNVVVRDKSGAPVRGLTADDFTLTEDGRPQTIQSFYFEEVGQRLEAPAAEPAPADPIVLAHAPPAQPRPPREFSGQRLVILFFDLSAMQPEEIERAAAAARAYVEREPSPSDRVAVVSLVSELEVVQDFTADRAVLLAALGRFEPTAGQGFEDGSVESSESAPESGAAFTPDDGEFAVFNTDRRLAALATLADSLRGIAQKKSVVYFSGGLGSGGVENQVQLRRAIDRAVRANVSIYTVDTRGLQAFVAGGEASHASLRGTAAFTGRSTADRIDRQFQSQEALTALADDTGGQALLESNDFGAVFDRVVADTAAYYVIGYQSTNPARDGRFRRVRVQTRRSDLKVEHRSGYYAPKDFAHSNRDDREEQLQDQLVSELSATDLPVYLSTAYFRVKESRFTVPVTIVVPGAKIPVARTSDSTRATIDVLGLILDERRRAVARVRDTMKLGEGAEGIARKNVQYQTTFELAPGRYRVKVVVRENQEGAFGSFETDFDVPRLERDALKLSSIVLGTDLAARKEVDDRSPLARLAEGLVPNVTHVVAAGRPLYFYFEVYDPTHVTQPDGASANAVVRVLASLSFYKGKTRVYQTPIIEATSVNDARRGATSFRLQVAPASLRPGLYTCQVNVIDDAAGTFAFPRLALYVRP